jgi:hypothetical protein
MTPTISMILTALASIDNGSVMLPVDVSLYSEAVLRAFAGKDEVGCHFSVDNDSHGLLLLRITASDPQIARLQIGHALNELLRESLRTR